MQIIRKCSNKNYDAPKRTIRKLNKTKINSISKIIENYKYKRTNNLEERKLVNEKGKNSISMTYISTLQIQM